MRTLVWITNSFRLNSRLMSTLSGECSFVYFSPYYFAGEREREMYKSCSQVNLDAFYSSINEFSSALESAYGAKLNIFRVQDPIKIIAELTAEYKYEKLVIDRPLFAMWHALDRKSVV